MRFLLINYFSVDRMHRFLRFKREFVRKLWPILANLDTEFKLVEVRRFADLAQYAYRNKQNYSAGIVKTLKNFKIIDIVIVGNAWFGARLPRPRSAMAIKDCV